MNIADHNLMRLLVVGNKLGALIIREINEIFNANYYSSMKRRISNIEPGIMDGEGEKNF